MPFLRSLGITVLKQFIPYFIQFCGIFKLFLLLYTVPMIYLFIFSPEENIINNKFWKRLT